MASFPVHGTEDWDDDLQAYVDEADAAVAAAAASAATSAAAGAVTDAAAYTDAEVAALQGDIDAKVSTVNGKSPVAGEVTLTNTDVGAAATSHTHDWTTGVTGKPTIIAAGATQALARAAIDAPATAHTHDWTTGVTGKPTFIGAGTTQANARSAIAAADDAAVVKLTGTQTIAGTKTFSTAPAVPIGAFNSTHIADMDEAVADALETASGVHAEIYQEGDPLPDLTGRTGIWVAIKVSAPAADPVFTTLATTPGSGTDGTSWNITLSRAFASGTYPVAMLSLASTGATAIPPSSFSGGGVTWTLATGTANTTPSSPMSNTTNDGKVGTALYYGSGTPSGTTLTLGSGSTTLHGAAWSIVEAANVSAPATWQFARSASTLSTTPSMSLTAVDPTYAVLGFLVQNSVTDATVGTGYTELGSLQAAPSSPPALSVKTQYRLDGVNSVPFAAPSGSSKVVYAVAMPPA